MLVPPVRIRSARCQAKDIVHALEFSPSLRFSYLRFDRVMVPKGLLDTASQCLYAESCKMSIILQKPWQGKRNSEAFLKLPCYCRYLLDSADDQCFSCLSVPPKMDFPILTVSKENPITKQVR
jgi:hypothetical protein